MLNRLPICAYIHVKKTVLVSRAHMTSTFGRRIGVHQVKECICTVSDTVDNTNEHVLIIRLTQ